MPQLIFNLPDSYPQVYELKDKKTTIGRNPDNTLNILDAHVSCFHSEIFRDANGQYLLSDNVSHNGTFVNGVSAENRVLKNGDEVKFGVIRALYVDLTEAARKETVLLDKKQQSLRKEIKESTVVAKQERLKIGRAKEVTAKENQSFLNYQKKNRELSLQVEAQKELLKKLASRVASKNRQRVEEEVGLNDCSKRFNDLIKQIEIKQNQFNELEVKEVAQKRRQVESQQQLDDCFKQLKNLTDQIDKKKAQLAQLDEVTESKNEETKRLSENLSMIEQKLQTTESAIADLDSQKTIYLELLQSIGEKQKELSAKEQRYDELLRSIDHKKQEFSSLREGLDKSEVKLDKAGQELVLVETKYQRLLKDVESSESLQSSLATKASSLGLLVAEKSNLLKRLQEKIGIGQLASDCPPLRIIDPNLPCLVHYFNQGPGEPASSRVLPVGFASLAACSKGSVHRDCDSIFDGDDPVLMLLEGNLEKDRAAVANNVASLPGRRILVSWSEGGLSSLMSKNGGLTVENYLNDVLIGVSGIISVDRQTAGIIDNHLDIGIAHLNLNLPCPLEDSNWDFALPVEERQSDIFVCSNGLDLKSALHRSRLEFLQKIAQIDRLKVTVYHHDKSPHSISELNRLSECKDVNVAYNYSEYLKLMAHHKLVVGFGKNFFGGELIDDALLTNTVYAGGDCDNFLEEHLYSETVIGNGNVEKAVAACSSILSNSEELIKTVDFARIMGEQHLSFTVGGHCLSDFVSTLVA